MAFETQVSELIPAGDGEVLWLGSQDAQRLIDGIRSGDNGWRAIVLEGLLGRFEKPAGVLHQLQPFLADDGLVIAVAAPRLGASSSGRFTRRDLLAIFARAGYDVTSCAAIHHPRLSWPALEVDGRAAGRPADALEEAASIALLVSARPATAPGPEYSIVVNGDYDGPRPEGVEVVTVGGESRARAWNEGARAARGRYLAFLDADIAPRPRFIESLLKLVGADTRVGAAGTQAVAFGPEFAPCQQLPYRIQPSSTGKVEAVEGAGMVIARNVFVAVGGFDARLGSRLDGPDLCLRLRARGFDVVYGREAAGPAIGSPGDESVAADGTRYFLLKWRGLIPQAQLIPFPKKKRLANTSPAPILWSAPLLQRSGYGEEARNFVLALDRHGIAVQANPTDWQAQMRLPRDVARRLGALLCDQAPDRFINVVNSFPAARMMVGGSGGAFPLTRHFQLHPRAVRNIGRTMYETDRIPKDWIDPCNQMDEIWVPSAFNVETFARSGVVREKLYRIPGVINTDRFRADLVPMYLPRAEGFVFLSVFAWSLRKGWDVLVRAFLEEFDHGEDVTLVLKVLPHWNVTLAQHEADLGAYVRDVLGRDLRAKPRILVESRDMDAYEMPRLYKAANAFVLP
ncbi:MAG TPA: glycosyltransferase, partial [Candidatus Acidoferrum sp.]|nr:glycosyltransferase [Candidatus Acidoferrum sp.]